MRVVIAPDSFKGSNTSVRVAETIERGILKVFPRAEVHRVPIADGGEGTVEAVVLGGGGEYRDVTVTGPLGAPVAARYGILSGGRGVIEMAAASGLPLVPTDRRDPLLTTTYGTGELIRDALDHGCTELLIGIGGSATNDAGVGMAQALGFSFLDASGHEVRGCGGDLHRIETIDTSSADRRLSGCKISVACDVRNPLYGDEGAAAIYGPQKGADEKTIESLDSGLRHFAGIAGRAFDVDLQAIPGAGAAGGLGAGLVVFCGAELKSGIDAILDIVRFDEAVRGADLVLTGEGAMDGSSTYGKVPVGIARRMSGTDIPVVAIVGDIGKGASAVYALGIDGIMSTVSRAVPLEVALRESSEMLEDAAERLMRFLSVGMRLGKKKDEV
jgi:glycerate 2-kinase